MKKRTIYRLLGPAAGTVLLLSAAGCGETEDVSRGQYEAEKTEEQQNPGPAVDPGNDAPDGEKDPAGGQEAPEDFDLYRELSDWGYVFSSGAGGWGTELQFEPDGSFHGSYHDSEMGDTGPGYAYGTVYICDFEGRCDNYEEISEGVYRVHIAALDYEPEDKTVIEDDLRMITAAPYGLEHTDELIVYLPGVPFDELEEGYVDWVAHGSFGQYVGENFDYYEDIPEELPFVGIYNPAEGGYGFYSWPECGRNKMCLKNLAKLPGLTNRELTFYEDGTYYCEDSDEEGGIVIRSVSIPVDDSFPDIYDDLEGFIQKCLTKIPGEDSATDLYVPETDNMNDPSLSYISGERIYYAGWDQGSGEDERLCAGIFHYTCDPSMYGEDIVGYAQVYMFSMDPDVTENRYEFMDQYLHSLAYSGSYEGLSSASAEKGARWILTEVTGGDGRGGILADEVVWISGDDTETLREYGIAPEDVANDYAIGGADGDFRSFALSADCPIYFRFTDNIFERYRSYDQFCTIMKDWQEGRLFWLLLDRDETVVAMYEPYTP